MSVLRRGDACAAWFGRATPCDMTWFAGRLTLVALGLSLMLMHQAMAVARGHGGAAQEVVLCTGQGIVVLTLAEDGTPIAPPHLCPDALALVLAAPLDAASPTEIVLTWHDLHARQAPTYHWQKPHRHAVARGPPWLL